ncbi:cytochrome b [Orbaceae bacterium ESL0727]|nr:cytochrome b [Orbaceae bacterium ESL0727]
MKNSPDFHFPHYNTWQVIIHWITALLIVIAISLALCRDILPDRRIVIMLHKSIGFLILLLTVWRLILIKTKGVPDVLDVSQRLFRALSKSVQGFIYIGLLVIPLSGYFMSNRGINFLDLFTIPGVSLPIEMRADMRMIHNIGAFIFIGLIVLHSAAALFHHFWMKDNVLRAMWFTRKN